MHHNYFKSLKINLIEKLDEKLKHPSAPENLTLPNPQATWGLQFRQRLGRRCSKRNLVFSCWSFWWARWPPPWLPSFVGGPWFSRSRIAPCICFNQPGQHHAEKWSSTVCSSSTIWCQWMRHQEKRWWHLANCCRKHVQEIVSKIELKASRPGSRRRAEAGLVGGLNQWGMRGGSACSPTLCQELLPQKGPWLLLKIDMRNAFNSLRRDSFLSVAHVRTSDLYNLLWQA